MLMNMKSNSKVGKALTETASIAYDGTLLPAGTAKYGSELVVNGGFDTSSGWTLGAGCTISGGTANFNTATNNIAIHRGTLANVEANAEYEVTYTVSNYVSGNVNVNVGGSISTPNRSANGTYTEVITVGASVINWIYITSTYAGTGFVGSVDNLSIKKVIQNKNKRYLKDLGKDKNHVLVESGQGKFFNGSNHCMSETWGNLGFSGVKTQFTFGFQYYASNGNYTVSTGYESGSSGMSIRCSTTTISVGMNNSTNPYLTVGVGSASAYVNITFNNGVVKIFINGVLAGTQIANISSLTFTSTEKLSIGAYRAASAFWAGIISNFTLYDVALTDAQISTLYQYPEKIKVIYNVDDPTRYKIVPDIGNEDNCKLFFPMSESLNGTTGNMVVNMAVAIGSELVTNGGFTTDTNWNKGVGWTISGGTLNANIGNFVTVNGSISLTAGKTYIISYSITSYTSGDVKAFFTGGTSVIGATRNAVGTYSEVLTALTGNNLLNFNSNSIGFVGSIDNVSVKEVSAFPIASFTASCVDSAKQLSYGAQCIAWKRDALGLPIGMSGGLSFDGGKSIKGVNTGWQPVTTDSFVVEAIVQIKDGVLNQVFGTAYGANTVVGIGVNSSGYPQGAIADKYPSRAISATTPRHIVVKYAGTVGSSQMWIDGVELSYTKETVFTNPTSPFYIGSFGSSSQKTINIGTTKIHKGTQYAKFDIAKSWKNAQKIIAKLGA